MQKPEGPPNERHGLFDVSKHKKCEKAHCDWPAMSQLPVCAYHYAKHTWWKEWADAYYPNHPEAKRKEQQ